jgi:hypothetical protein
MFTQASSSRNKYFHSFDAIDAASTGDAIDDWLNTPPSVSVNNPLQYWTAMAASGHPLAAMAKDFLSVPGKQTNSSFVPFTQYITCSYVY